MASESSDVIKKDGELTLNTGASSGSSLTGGKKNTITSEKDDTGAKFTITGINASTGQSDTEVVNASNGTVQSTGNHQNNKITTDKQTAGAVKAGVLSGDDFSICKNIEVIQFDDKTTALKASTKIIDNDGDGVADGKVTKGADTADSLSADLAGNHNDTIDTADGDDVISAGNGADIIKGGAGSDYIFGGANTGKDNQGKAQKDVAVYDGRSTEVDLNVTAKVMEKKDLPLRKGSFFSGVDSYNCELTKLTSADVDDVADESACKVTAGGSGLTLTSGATTGSALTGGKNITVTSVGDDTGAKFTVTGTDINGNSLTEIITGAKAGETATTTQLFSKVSKITSDKETVGKVKAGFAEKAGSVKDKDITATASTQPDIFISAEEKIALTVVKGYNVAGVGDTDDTVEIAEAVDQQLKNFRCDQC